MPDEPQDPNSKIPKRLISVEFQTEVDVPTGTPERRMFLKMYFDARDSGLLADIGDRRWRTLSILATYMDERGLCYPSQARIAKDLGIHRQRVNERVQELLAYRFQGKPVITVKKARLTTPNGGRWANNVYQILPVTGLRIFDDAGLKTPKTLGTKPSKPYVRESGHSPMSAKPDTGKADTNQNHSFNKTLNVSVLKKHSEEGQIADANLRAQSVVLDILDVCKDQHSTGFYLQIARTLPPDLIYRALSETKHHATSKRIRKSRGAFFTDTLRRLARERGLDLTPPSTEPL